MTRILVGTDDGIRSVGPDAAGDVELAGRAVTALGREGREMWALLDRRQVWHTAGIEWWFHVGDLDRDGHCIADTRAGVIVGTAEAHLVRVAGEGLEPIGSFDGLEGRVDWYTPWGGPADVRSISEDDRSVYVNVHVGGIARSVDKGATWEPTIDIHTDVHRVWAGDGHVFAACARGLAASADAGDTWEMRADGLHSTYCRGVTVTGDTVLVSASSGPRGGHAAIYRGSLDGGELQRCTGGLPEWFDGNIDSSWLDATPDLAAFATADGKVFSSSDRGESWTEVASGLPTVHCLLVMP